MSGLGSVRRGRHGIARRGSEWQEWLGEDWLGRQGFVGHGKERQARHMTKFGYPPRVAQRAIKRRNKMFGISFKGRAKEAINSMSGNRDFLEGLCSICALVAAVDGSIDDKEFDKTITVIKSNSAIAAGFNAQEIETTFGRLAPKTATRSGRSELKSEIQQVLDRDKTGNMGMALMIAALDVADEGGIDEKEMTILRDLASLCGQNLDKLLAA